jgi:hypothetical protein
LVPLVPKIATTELAAIQWETPQLLDETKRLLRIEGQTKLSDSAKFDFVVWIDVAGRICKQHVPSINQTAYATDRATAIAASTDLPPDLADENLIPVRSMSKNPHRARHAVYEIRNADDDVKRLLMRAESGSQTSSSLSDGTLRITVFAVRPNSAVTSGHLDKPTDADISANSTLDCGDHAIVQLSHEVAPTTDEAWAIAVALERHVNEWVERKDYSRTFDSASKVVRTRAGDCTEHAVLLAAACRARKIPARVALGLIYGAGQFGLHAWTEVWVQDRWIPLDATMAAGGIGVGHIKISDTNFAETSPAAALLPAIALLGKKIEIHVVSLEGGK